MAQRETVQFTGYSVPQAGGLIAAGGNDLAPIWTERCVENFFTVSQGWAAWLACVRVPELSRVIFACRKRMQAVGAEHRPSHLTGVLQRRDYSSARARVPDDGRAVITSRNDPRTVGTKGRAPNPMGVAKGLTDFFARRCIPELRYAKLLSF